MKNKILIGVSGSGKSTYANKFKESHTITSRDTIREQLFGSCGEDYYSAKDLKDREEVVTKYQLDEIRFSKKPVVVDNTNLSWNYIEKYVFDNNYDTEFVFFNTPIDECIKNDLGRDRKVGESVIIKQHKRFVKMTNLLGNYSENLVNEVPYKHPYIKTDARIGNEYPTDPNLPTAVIVDLDGTLSMMNGRSPFKGKDCGTDVLNTSLEIILNSLVDSNVIYIFSGRNSDKGGAEATEKWLEDNLVSYDHLVMRKAGDMRSDVIIKTEMFDEHIRGRYNVLCAFDDRNCVVDLWRSMGIQTYQAYYGDF